MEMIERIRACGVVPVVSLERAEDAVPLAEALMRGGLPCAEVTFRTDAAAESIRRIRAACPEMLLGAGTVMTEAQAAEAVSSGAEFIVTPGYNERVVRYCIEHEIPVLPGVMDTYAIERALADGIETVKFFPAEAAGGLRMIRALAAPYRMLRFLPTGGIHEENMTDYLRHPKVVAVGGSWLVSGKLIGEGRFDRITELAAAAAAKVREVRETGEQK